MIASSLNQRLEAIVIEPGYSERVTGKESTEIYMRKESDNVFSPPKS
jgi:hypothetical protein